MTRARISVPAAVMAVLALASGCVMPDDIARLRKDVADVRAEMLTIQKEQAAARTTLEAVEARLAEAGEVKRADFADLKARVDDLDRSVGAAAAHADETGSRVDRLSQDVARLKETTRRTSESVPPPGSTLPPAASGSTGTTAGGSVPPVSSAAPTPEALYNQAYSDFSKGNYGLAAAGFEEYATRFPDSDQADNALYWIGESHYSEAQFASAVEAFDRMLERYPDSDRAAAANLKKALAYLEENDLKLAIVQFEYVVRNYPSSDEAKIARDKLASLGVR